MQSKKVLIYALENINNVGEEFLKKTTEFLIKKTSDDYKIISEQLRPNVKQVMGLDFVFYCIGALIKRIGGMFGGNIRFLLINLSYRVKYTNYYAKHIKNSDYIVLAVGMFKYSVQDFSFIFHLIAKLASRYNKKLMFSAMSIEKGNYNDWRSRQIKETLNEKSIKIFTTRDGNDGINILERDYLNNKLRHITVGDPALWIPDCYGIQKKTKFNNTPFIGINIIREGIFDDYNESFTDKKLFDVYVTLISLLENRKWNWAVFVNGIKSDWDVLVKLQNAVGFSEEHIIKCPKNGTEFLKTIIQFDAIFCARLHACIASYSLGIPIVSFIWDDKLRFFGQTMGMSKFFLESQDLTATKVLSALEIAMQFDIPDTIRENSKQSTLTSFKEFLLSDYYDSK